MRVQRRSRGLALIDEKSIIQLHLRERRANITERSHPLQGNVSRRKTFAAAMQQFEEQMAAANVVTSATSSLNLYYGLAQAGLAIAAAKASEPWTFSSHGLELVDTRPDLADICVRPKGRGGFQAVASVTGSPVIETKVSIGALWASLPDLAEYAPLRTTSYPTALYVAPGMPSMWGGIAGGPSEEYYSKASATVYFRTKISEENANVLFARLISDYPTADGWQVDSGGSFTDSAADKNSKLRIALPSSTDDGLLRTADVTAILDVLAPEYLYTADRYMRPSVEGAAKPPPSPLMTWWLLLYSFSMLARYQPRKWTDLLILDRPGCANQIRFALERAISVIPQLLIGALDEKPWLLPKPAQWIYGPFAQ